MTQKLTHGLVIMLSFPFVVEHECHAVQHSISGLWEASPLGKDMVGFLRA